jgi:hypothetical protein
MFVDAKGHLHDLDLLKHARSSAGVLQGSAAVGAVIECVGMGVVDLFRRERRTVVRFMAHLRATLSFAAVRRLVLGLLDDITGGRLGRSRGVLAGDRQVRSQLGDLRIAAGDLLLQFGASCARLHPCGHHDRTG